MPNATTSQHPRLLLPRSIGSLDSLRPDSLYSYTNLWLRTDRAPGWLGLLLEPLGLGSQSNFLEQGFRENTPVEVLIQTDSSLGYGRIRKPRRQESVICVLHRALRLVEVSPVVRLPLISVFVAEIGRKFGACLYWTLIPRLLQDHSVYVHLVSDHVVPQR